MLLSVVGANTVNPVRVKRILQAMPMSADCSCS
jgi:hypothetical protein